LQLIVPSGSLIAEKPASGRLLQYSRQSPDSQFGGLQAEIVENHGACRSVEAAEDTPPEAAAGVWNQESGGARRRGVFSGSKQPRLIHRPPIILAPDLE
jgi:hypothetical protein